TMKQLGRKQPAAIIIVSRISSGKLANGAPAGGSRLRPGPANRALGALAGHRAAVGENRDLRGVPSVRCATAQAVPPLDQRYSNSGSLATFAPRVPSEQ